jgi:hypothetical protein
LQESRICPIEEMIRGRSAQLRVAVDALTAWPSIRRPISLGCRPRLVNLRPTPRVASHFEYARSTALSIERTSPQDMDGEGPVVR